MSTALPSLGFAGIGLMGLPMCRRLLAAGYPLTVWNRSPDKCEALVEAGARLANSPAELCQGSDMVLLCLADTAVVREVVFGEHGIAQGGRSGQLLIDFSSLEPTATREMAAEPGRTVWHGLAGCPGVRRHTWCRSRYPGDHGRWRGG